MSQATTEGRSAAFLERLRRRGRPAWPPLPATRGTASGGARERGRWPAWRGEWTGACALTTGSGTARAGRGGVWASGWQAWSQPPLSVPSGGRWAGSRDGGGGTGRARPAKSSLQGLGRAEPSGEPLQAGPRGGRAGVMLLYASCRGPRFETKYIKQTLG